MSSPSPSPSPHRFLPTVTLRSPLLVTLFAFVLAAGVSRTDGAAAGPHIPQVAGASAEDVPAAQRLVDAWVKSAQLEGVKVGVAVAKVDPRGEAFLGGHHADDLMNPASGTKLLTTAAALRLMPPTTRFATRLHGEVGPGGVVEGDLYLVGEGDPKLMPEHVRALADALVAAGVKEVKGDLVVDASRFDAQHLPPAYDQKSTDEGYRAAIGAVAVNFGAARVTVTGGRRAGDRPSVSIDPASDYFDVDNRATTAGKGISGLSVATSALPDGRTRLTISGRIGPRATFSRRRRVAHPDVFTAHLLRGHLARAGVVATELPIRKGDSCPQALPELARVESEPLVAALTDVNVWSNNFMAEMIFKHLGRGPAGEPASFDRAKDVVTKALVDLGLDPKGFRVVNGSGLYQATFVSPRSMARLLVLMARSADLGPTFIDTLAVAGRSGTLSQRLSGALTGGKVKAKSGTLDDVISLSGYIPTRTGDLLAFSVMINKATPARQPALRGAIDRLVRALAQL